MVGIAQPPGPAMEPLGLIYSGADTDGARRAWGWEGGGGRVQK